MMEAIQKYLEQLRSFYESRTEREQKLLLFAGIFLSLMALYSFGEGVYNGIWIRADRIESKISDLETARALLPEYATRKKAFEQEQRKLSRSQKSLVQRVEESAEQAGLQETTLRPQEGKPNDVGLVESKVELKIKEVSIDRLQKFFETLGAMPERTVVKKIDLRRKYNQEALYAEIVIHGYKLENTP